ncbi:MAG TPA: hypothetical protein VHS56_14430 [Candidatus Cybelea sp.]|nr:hypothetical protein [Candidatus Cybelea sp.]
MKLFRTLSSLVCLSVAGCAGTNVTPALTTLHGDASALSVKPDKSPYKRALYVLNSAADAVQIFTNTYYRQLGAITSGISGPKAITIDPQGNLYVTNQAASFGDVAQYVPRATSPSFTYDANEPQGVAVDRHGNIFVADYAVSGFGVINQYARGLKDPIASCIAAQSVYGVAVDSSGNVFVSVWQGDNAASIIEFSGGLKGCNSTLLTSFGSRYIPPPSLALDANNNLIVPWGPTVYVLDPPYSAVTTTIGSGFSSVSGVSLNKKSKLLFVSDSGTNTVTVINYKTGVTVTQLGLPNGISQADGVVDAPNAVL